MFSSSAFQIKRRRLHIKFIKFSLVKIRPQYVAAMAHQEVFQQQINTNQLTRVQPRWGRRARVRRILWRQRLHPEIIIIIFIIIIIWY